MFVCGVLASPLLYAKGSTAAAAAACTDAGKCPYFSDIYKADAAVRSAFSEAMGKAGIKKLSWFPKGVNAPITPILIGDGTYISSQMCEPHNCGAQGLDFLYRPDQKRAVGRLQSEEGKSTWFGSPTPAEQKAIVEMADENSAINKALSAGKPLPLRAD